LLAVSLAEDLLFAQTNLENLYAFDAESGQLLWVANLGRPTDQALPASVNSNSVFATNANNLYQLDRATGRVVRQILLDAFATSPTVANEDLVAVGLETGKVMAFHVRDRSGEDPPGPSAGSFAFAWKSAAAVTSRPLLTDKLIIFGSQDNRLFTAINEPPSIFHRFLTGGPIVAPITPYGTRTVLVPSLDNNVYAVDLFEPGSGTQTEWTLATGAPVNQEPLVSGDEAYVINARGTIFAVDPQSGSVRWSRPTGGGKLLSLSPRRISLLSPEGDLFLIDRGTGDVIASPRATRERVGLRLRHYDRPVTNQLNDRMYLASSDGQLVCIHEIGFAEPQNLRTKEEIAAFGTPPVEEPPPPPGPGMEPINGEQEMPGLPPPGEMQP
jgi:outer membrane protein assembly factor BamB